MNTLIMEQALGRAGRDRAPDRRYRLRSRLSSQSGFTRFFAANVGMAPTDYRRAAKVLRP